MKTSSKQNSQLSILTLKNLEPLKVNSQRRTILSKKFRNFISEVASMQLSFGYKRIPHDEVTQSAVLLRYLHRIIEQIEKLFIESEHMDFISTNLIFDEIEERLDKAIDNFTIVKSYILPKRARMITKIGFILISCLIFIFSK